MMRTNRTSFTAILNFLALGIFLSGCIVVVKEDDDDRHRYLRDSEWTLEVVFYRTETLVSADRTIQVGFSEDNTLTGIAACGAFSGVYDVNENGGFSVSSLETPEQCSASSEVELVASSLRAASRYSVTESELTISTDQDGYLSFSAK